MQLSSSTILCHVPFGLIGLCSLLLSASHDAVLFTASCPWSAVYFVLFSGLFCFLFDAEVPSRNELLIYAAKCTGMHGAELICLHLTADVRDNVNAEMNNNKKAATHLRRLPEPFSFFRTRTLLFCCVCFFPHYRTYSIHVPHAKSRGHAQRRSRHVVLHR